MGLMPTPTGLAPGAAPFANGQKPPAPDFSQPTPADGSASIGGGDENVSPEEQAMYDKVMEKAAELIYGGDSTVEPAVLQALNVPPTPETPDSGKPEIMALANAAFQIVKKLDDSSREQGQPIPDDVLYHAGTEIIEELGEVARTANMHDYSPEELTGAFYQLVDLYRPQAIESGRTTEDQLKGQFGEIQQANDQGRLEEAVPGVGAAEAAAPADGQDSAQAMPPQR